MLNAAFNAYLSIGTFHGRWKWARFALLSKPVKPEGIPSSFWLLYLLDDVGMILETLHVNCMERYIMNSGIELFE